MDDEQADDDALIYCSTCDRLYALADCELRNADRLILRCPGCGAEWLRFAARPPVAEAVEVEVDGEAIEVPPFVAERWGPNS